MILKSAHITHLKSIDDLTLDNLGNFNVLIGKNNSGKSNILSAVDIFFQCVKKKHPITIATPVRKEIDFFQKNLTEPIRITLTFLLNNEEIKVLVHNINSEAPQMKNASDGLTNHHGLSITLVLTQPPKPYGYISKISIFNSDSLPRILDERTILHISPESAQELSELQFNGKKFLDDVKTLQKAENEDLRYVFRDSEMRTRGLDYLKRRVLPLLSEETQLIVQNSVKELKTPEELEGALAGIRARLNEEAEIFARSPIKNKINTFSGEEAVVPQYVRHLLSNISDIKILQLKERRNPIGKTDAEKLLKLKTARGGTDILTNIQFKVENLLGVKVDAFNSESPKRGSETLAEIDVDNFLVEVNGSGIREALRIILDVEFEHPDILLVEEPELSLHPGLETSMMQYLKEVSSNCQVFLTTHSTNFLDSADMNNIYLISRNGSTKIQLLNTEEIRTKISKELGIRLSSLFMFDRLVFVEGPTDEKIIRIFASKFGENFNKNNVGFIQMDGVGNFAHYAANKTLDFLSNRQVKTWFIIDHDEKSDADFKKLRDKLQERGEFKGLSKRQIENYLLSDNAIAEYINIKKHVSTESEKVKSTDINTERITQVENLKNVTIEKRVACSLCKPIYFDRNKIDTVGQDLTTKCSDMVKTHLQEFQDREQKIKEVISQETKFVGDNWNTKKFDIIPGNLLIDEICKKNGVRFKKEKDSELIASLMNSEEIDTEIKDLIHEICN